MAGIGTRKLTIEVDGVDYSGSVSNAVVRSAESDADFVTFASASQGGARSYVIAISTVQDAAAGSLWSMIMESAGDEVEIVIAPYGNSTPSPAEPHYTMTAIVSEPDGDLLGGAADRSATARFVTECEWSLLAKPLKVTA